MVPSECRKCGEQLQGNDPEPLRHQVFELPSIQPIVIEYQRHRLTCECCGTRTCGELPVDVPTGQCGPRLAAFTGLLMGHFRQSKRRAASFLSDLLNIPCSASWTVKIQKQVSEALALPYCELQGELTKQKQLFVDESPTKQASKKAWLWVAVAPLFAVFGIFLNRKRESLKTLVGDYSGTIINCDRAKMYFDGKQLQWCWSHLKRDFQKLIDNPDRQVKRLGHDLMRQEKLLFELWHQFVDFYRDKRHRTDEQHSRTSIKTSRHLSQVELWNAKPSRQSVYRTHPHSFRDLQDAKAVTVSIPGLRYESSFRQEKTTLFAPHSES